MLELKDHLNFNLIIADKDFDNKSLENQDILLCHDNIFKDISILNNIKNSSKIKILLFSKTFNKFEIFNEKIKLPISILDLNSIIENSIIKKSFSKNSSIKIKNYFLDKNEKKLIDKENFIFLTEKEIQLLELFITNDRSLSKNFILNQVWKYSDDADTHTVETHIYRLRKKIKSKFNDEKFIFNNKDGYSLWKNEIRLQ